MSARLVLASALSLLHLPVSPTSTIMHSYTRSQLTLALGGGEIRPGRLDKVLYVPLPSPAGRLAVLTALARQTPLGPGVDLAAIAADARASGFSGADLQQLLREAAVCALKVPTGHSHCIRLTLETSAVVLTLGNKRMRMSIYHTLAADFGLIPKP